VARVLVSWKDRDRQDLTGPLAEVLSRSVRAALHELSGVGPPVPGRLTLLDVNAVVRARGPVDARRTPTVRQAPARPVLLVPVPSAPAANRRRGRDVLAVLAQEAARSLRQQGLPVSVGRALRVRRAVRDQSGLAAAERAANVAAAFTVRTQMTGTLLASSVVIVDDVTTTGASLAEAARAIAQVGGRVVAAATVCTTPRRPLGAELAEDHSLVRCRTPRDWSSVEKPLRLTAQRSRKEGAGLHG
jgi:phosphoribosylpyrophosphate synthetase